MIMTTIVTVLLITLKTIIRAPHLLQLLHNLHLLQLLHNHHLLQLRTQVSRSGQANWSPGHIPAAIINMVIMMMRIVMVMIRMMRIVVIMMRKMMRMTCLEHPGSPASH